MKHCAVILTGLLQYTAKQRGPVPSDARGGAPAAGGGVERSGRDYQGEGGALENPAQETATGTRPAGEEVEAEEQVQKVQQK